ncbi:uncharacterized protein G2W53_023548 [Senna tora]|uniref:Uncharacterized protein n=1 Tax=Senna tora TaxID=362788 RepID=A0A834T9A9_9FABA|nr:uncharacterized protein G2W53_023548 [Senna tora]
MWVAPDSRYITENRLVIHEAHLWGSYFFLVGEILCLVSGKRVRRSDIFFALRFRCRVIRSTSGSFGRLEKANFAVESLRNSLEVIHPL